MSLVDDILNSSVIDGVVTSMSERENYTCLQKITAIDKLIKEYNKKYNELNDNYNNIAENIDDIERIASESETVYNNAIQTNNEATNLINSFSSKYPTSMYKYNISNGNGVSFEINNDYNEIWMEGTSLNVRFDVFIYDLDSGSDLYLLELTDVLNKFTKFKITRLSYTENKYNFIFELEKQNGELIEKKQYIVPNTSKSSIIIYTNVDSTGTIWSTIERRE